jgi:asparagine synthetase B (glutamine-hydrolysing)
MWALAFYDAQEKTLLVSRDRLGIKPLYPAVLIGHLPVPECAKSAVR